jgi:hypothetical protein
VREQEVEALRQQLVAIVSRQFEERVVGVNDRIVGLLGVGEYHWHARRIRRDHEGAKVLLETLDVGFGRLLFLILVCLVRHLKFCLPER